MKSSLIILITTFAVFFAKAQLSVKITIAENSSKKTVAAATISLNEKILAITDSTGSANIVLQNSKQLLLITCIGYEELKKIISIPVTGNSIELFLNPLQKEMDEVVIVSSTRNNQRIENAPLKVEVLGRAEMDEENTIKPASIASILGDVSGVQIQQSSAITGNANVRIQGLDGRYTQILKDGMPLYDGFSGGFGILSIPPLDLKQVELIKGSASTLYGAGAIGGLVNIISRKPSARQDAVLTLNQTTLKETNINTYLAKKYKHTGYTFFAGFTNQVEADVNKDGFSDVARLQSFIIHPRLFFYPSANTTITTGYTGTFENRIGGDMQVIKNTTDAAHQFFEKNKTARHSAEFLLEQNLSKEKKLVFKSSISSFNRAITSNTHFFKGRQFNYFTEAALYIPYKKNAAVVGINVLGDRFKKLPADPVALINTSNNTIGVFVQNTWQIKEYTTIEAGLRNDYVKTYGNFLLPRFSVFQRFNTHWATRFGIGLGYKTPNALSAQTKDYAIEQLLPISLNIKSEKSTGYNAEINYKTTWGEDNSFFVNHAFFLTAINKPVIATEQPNGMVVFSNAPKSIITKGFDTYVQATIQNWEIYAGYTFTIAERKYLQQNQFVAYTAKQRMAFTLVKEFAQTWRMGLEGSYNGYQYREDGTKTPAYVFLAGLVEKKFGRHISLILNCENILDYRQSRKEALYTGSITNPQFKTLWAPIDGLVLNLALRIKM